VIPFLCTFFCGVIKVDDSSEKVHMDAPPCTTNGAAASATLPWRFHLSALNLSRARKPLPAVKDRPFSLHREGGTARRTPIDD